MVILGRKLNYNLLFWLLFYFLIFGLLLNNSFSYLDPDLGWHLKVGEEIARSGLVPHENVYNYTFSGNWVDHEWLINYISFEIYSRLGYFALTIFFIAIIVFSLILLNVIIKKCFNKKLSFFLAGLQLFGLIACLPHFGVRMQEFGFLFLILELGIIFAFNKKKKKRLLLWLLPLFYLWANIHGSFLLGLGLLFLWPLVKLVEHFLNSTRWKAYFLDSEIITWLEVKIFYLSCLASLAVTFFTPYGRELYSFLSGYRNSFYLQAIQEWLPQLRIPFNYWQLGYLLLVVMTIFLCLYNVLGKKKEKIDLWLLSLTCLLTILSFKSRRHFPLFFATTLFFLYPALENLLELDKIKSWLIKSYLKYLFLFCLGLAGLSLFVSANVNSDPFKNYCSNYPCRATEFLKNEKQYEKLNIFNEYNWGGYLIWTYPDKILFIDGRIPQAEYAGRTLLEEYLEFFKSQADYEAKLNQYNIELVLTKTQDSEIKVKTWEKIFFLITNDELTRQNYLRNYLERANNWQKIYSDPLASIYLKVK